MVATRRGVRVVESPTKTNREDSSSASDTATSTRRTRRVTVQHEAQPVLESKSDAQKAEGEVISTATTQEDKPTEEAVACVENQPDDIHDADVSDSESCCSVVSNAQAPSTRSTRKRGLLSKNPTSGTEGVSEVESCVSATPRRSTRAQKKKVPFGCDGVEHSEAESCSSVTSLSKRTLTRSQRKTGAPQSASHTEDTEHSEHDSYDLRKSTLRKNTRGRRTKPVEPVPIDLEDSGDVSSSSVPRRTPARRAKAAPSSEACSQQVSEDNESGPSAKRATRSRAKDTTVRGASDSESDLTGYSSLGSPCSVLGRSTPCSSRTGSASSNRAVPVSRVTRSLRSDAAHAASPLPAEGQTPSQRFTPLSDAMETAEEMEVDGHEVTVIVTGEEGEASLLAEVGEEDKTLVTMEEEEADARGVNVVDPAVLDATENAHTVTPSVVVTESACPGAEIAEEMSPTAEEHSGKAALKGSVTVSEEAESSVGSVSIVTPRVDRATVTVSEVAEADSTEEVGEGDKLLTAADEQVRCGQTVKVTASDSTAELESITVKVTEEITETATELDVPCEQTVKVTLCDASESKEERIDDASAQPGSHSQGAEENDQEPTGPDTSSLKSVKVTEVESGQDEEDQPMEVDDASDHAKVSESVTDVQVSVAQDGDEQPSGSGASQKPAAVSLLDSSDDEEDDDDGSDMCSLNEEPAGVHEASESEEDEGGATEKTLTVTVKPRAKVQTFPGDGLFVIDTQPGLQSSRAFYTVARPSEEEQDEDGTTGEARGKDEEDEEFVDEEEDEEDEDAKILFTCKNPALKELSCFIDPGLKVKELGGLYINFDGRKSKKVSSSLKTLKDQKHLDELMKKSVVGPSFEKKDSIPPYKESRNATKLKRRMEREKTTGDGWFNMKAPEMTEELKNDLKAIQMRSAMDPKRFYKKNDREGFSKYVQVGTVVDSPLDFYHSRIPKKERKRTIVEELLADAEFRSYNKKKFQEIMSDKAALLAGKKHRKKKFKSK
ncbi:deoxynucleotidyltransferase terminal-interacting protein 2 [Alosa sapidissima]|uniref:deoxynucleotidyltransferase terminal-interacting protein 2 n=1 Tax=Alosa sapidissima TaxID=34773 RepID=UPI001C092881|nr:deoxynucleotidyltransferase terminal-interacting protein 2 [Alosa sapidissima]